MSFFGDLYRGEVHFDFPKAWKRGFVLSAVLVVASVGGFVLRGLNLGIDFEGGTAWEVPGAQEVSVGKVRDALEPFGQASAKVQFIGGDTLRVQADADQAEEVTQITEALADLADVPVGDVSVSTVGPAWGEEITRQAIRALLFFFIAIALYISVRLEWKMAIGALVAVLHDVVITVGFYAVTQLEVTPATVISFLTILGYSLYDTIVVYDRVRENAARLTGTGRMTYTAMTNLSLNQVFVRSINTTIVAVLPVISLLVVGSLIMGAVTLQEFAIALLVGLLVGSYSSIFLASPIVALIHEREPRNRAIRERLAARGETAVSAKEAREAQREAEGTRTEQPASGTAAGGRSQVAAADRPAPSGPYSHPPRPRKKTKRRRP